MAAPAMATLPRPLAAALGLVAAEGVFFLGYAVLEVVLSISDRWVMSTTTGVFFAAYGAGLLVCVWGAVTRRPWARSPMVLAQLIQLTVAWGFLGGATTPVAVLLMVVAALVLVGLLLPSSTAVLLGDDSAASHPR